MAVQTFIDREGLVEKGINYSRAQLHRLIKHGKFPRLVKLGSVGDGDRGRNVWLEAEIDAYIAGRIAERDRQAA